MDTHDSLTLHKVAFLGDYVPRKCGIATFTADLRTAVAEQYPGLQCPVFAVNDAEEGYDYPPEVRFDIPQEEMSAYRRAGDFMNLANTDVLSVQHEYGIYGGPTGSHVLALLRNVRMPIVTTLHTILNNPSPEQKRVMDELVKLSTRVVAMAEKGVEFLRTIYQVPAGKIDLIPHGIPDVPFVDPNFFKDQFGVEGKTVLLTFGLLSPNKGIEYVLNALPAIVENNPNVVYIVLGATHPTLLREQGETYRIGLERIAKKNGIEKNVIFFNRYVSIEELVEFIGAADIYVTPYLNEAQITSGTLAYSFGCGKAVVSTPYWHATELLDEGRGVLVPFADSGAIARAINNLLAHDAQRHAMRKSAYRIGRDMIWPRVAQLYVESFARARNEQSRVALSSLTLDRQPDNLPVLRLDHLVRMTDSTGMFQHAVFNVPDFRHGYCTDDNARALIFMVLLEQIKEKLPEEYRISGAYAAFIQSAFDEKTRRFRNFMSFSRDWLEKEGSEDSHGRALWALGTCVGRSKRVNLRGWAALLFEQAMQPVVDFTSPRAWAFTMIGLHEYLRLLSGDRRANQLREDLTDRLLGIYKNYSSPDWQWFENSVTYDNAKLSQALILSGRWSGRSDALEAGLTSLRWLAEHQRGVGGVLRPIGSNGFWTRGGQPAQFDQQPLEAHAMLSACIEAFNATGDRFWIGEAWRSFEWFLGANDLSLPLYDANTGGCRDGLHIDRVNQNQGAESTLSFLLSLAEIRAAQNVIEAFEKPSAE